MEGRRTTYSLLAMLIIAVLTAAMPASALSTADSFGVNDAMGNPGTVVSVPITIENVQDGPIIVVIFSITYDTSVITFNSVQRGDMIPTWDSPAYYTINGTTTVTLSYDAPNVEHGLQNGSTGTVAIFNFNVVGAGGSSSDMTMSNIQFTNPSYQVGSAPANDGVFRVDAGVPIVTNMSANPTEIEANGVAETTLTVTAYDDIALEIVTVNLTQLGGPAAVNLTPQLGNLAAKVLMMINDTLFSTTTTAAPGTAPGTYYLPINATDALGNSNTTETFTVVITAPATGTVSGTITKACDDTGLEGVTVNLTQDTSVVASTTTDSTGNFTFSDVDPGDYSVNASKERYWENATAVTVTGGAMATADMLLWLKGDLNDNCLQADAGDLAKMKDASVGKIDADWRFDLNYNDLNADAGDLAKMKDASVGKIELL